MFFDDLCFPVSIGQERGGEYEITALPEGFEKTIGGNLMPTWSGADDGGWVADARHL